MIGDMSAYLVAGKKSSLAARHGIMKGVLRNVDRWGVYDSSQRMYLSTTPRGTVPAILLDSDVKHPKHMDAGCFLSGEKDSEDRSEGCLW